MSRCYLMAMAIWIGVVAAVAGAVPLGSNAPRLGDVAPPLQISQFVQGPPTNVLTWADLRGKVVVLEFWQINCGPCQEAIPHVNELVNQFKDRPVVFISLSSDNPDRLKAFLRRKPMNSWVAVDQVFDATQTSFGVHGFPTTFVIDPAGRIAAVTHPALLDATNLEEVLAGKACSLDRPNYAPKVVVTQLGRPKPSLHTNVVTENVSMAGPFPVPASGSYGARGWNPEHTIFTGEKCGLSAALPDFYGVHPRLMEATTSLPDGLYDLRGAGPTNLSADLQRQFSHMLQTNLHLAVWVTNELQDVYVIRSVSTNVSGLAPVKNRGGGGDFGGGFKLEGATMGTVADFLESHLDKPCVDKTGLTGFYAVELKWRMSAVELLPDKIGPKEFYQLTQGPIALVSGAWSAYWNGTLSLEDFMRLADEGWKADGGQFLPDPAEVIKAAREQLGLEIKVERRAMRVLRVEPGE